MWTKIVSLFDINKQNLLFLFFCVKQNILKAYHPDAIHPQPGRFMVDFEDISMLRDIKKAIDRLDDFIKEIENG